MADSDKLLTAAIYRIHVRDVVRFNSSKARHGKVMRTQTSLMGPLSGGAQPLLVRPCRST